MAGEGGNIMRNVFGKSYKEAEQIMKDASKGTLDFKSPQENTFYGKKGGKKFDEYQAKEQTKTLQVKAVKCYEDFACTKEIKIIEKGKSYFFKAIQYNRTPTKSELKNLKWAIQYDDANIANAPQVTGEDKISYAVPKERKITKLRVYAFFRAPDEKVCADLDLLYPKEIYIIITDTLAGYTIQKIFDIDAPKKNLTTDDKWRNFADALEGDFVKQASTVSRVYLAEVWLFENRKKNKKLFEFNLTRDGFQKIDEKDGKYYIINRAFEPTEENLVYDLKDYKFPQKLKMKWDAFKFYEEDESQPKLRAVPLIRNKKLDDKTPIHDARSEIDYATDVMIHIGGHYSAVKWLGGSLGCFGFVDKDDIRSNPTLVLADAKADVFDDVTSDDAWSKVVSQINDFRKQYKAPLKCKIIKRKNYLKEYWMNKNIPYYLYQ